MRLLRWTSLLILLLCMPLVISAQTVEDGFTRYDRVTRTYSVALPDSYQPDTPAPLVIALHGAGDTGTNFRERTRIADIANELGYIAVFPNGIDNGWLYLDQDEMFDAFVDDVGFIEFFIDHLSEEYNVDQERVYLYGLSNGALMALRAGCENADRLAGVVAIATTYSFELSQHCIGTEIAPTMLVWGTGDQVFPQNGFVIYREGISVPRSSFSLSQTRSYLRSRFECSDESSQIVSLPNQVFSVVRLGYSGCEQPVLFYVIGDYPHAYPSDVAITLLDGESTGTMEDAGFDFFEQLHQQSSDAQPEIEVTDEPAPEATDEP